MRELKFRAWDKVAKKFLYPWPDGFHILGETTCFDLIGQQLKERNPEKSTLSMLNDIEITEYTGLKDKNGKEIYEGDIVRDTIPEDEPVKDTRIICWIENMCGFQAQTLDNKFIGFIQNDYVEIIGTVYENKDLISG